MTVEIDSIISSAMATLDSGGSDGGDTGDTGGTDDTSGDAGTTDATDLPAADSTDASADAAPPEADASGLAPALSDADTARLAEEEAWAKELEEMGVARPKLGQKDNRMPYSRVSKVILNAKTKWSEKQKADHTAALKERDDRIQANAERQTQFDNAERFIESDPDGYLEFLATVYPEKYKGFARGAAAAAKQDPEPGPDVKYDDGSFGYSPEQFSKLREYDRREAARQAKDETTKEFDKRFKPIEDERKAIADQNKKVQTVRGDIGKLREQWGGDLIDNPEVQSQIVKYMDDNPKSSLVASTRTVIMGRIQADRNKMRAELQAELKAAPKAASSKPVAPDKTDAANSSDSLDDIILKAMRSIKD